VVGGGIQAFRAHAGTRRTASRAVLTAPGMSSFHTFPQPIHSSALNITSSIAGGDVEREEGICTVSWSVSGELMTESSSPDGIIP
jgi:hypothetical protein